MRTRARVAALAVVLLTAAGCTDDGPSEPPAAPPPDPPQPFRAAAEAPAGWQLTQCSDLRSHDNSGLATRFGVPPAFAWLYRDGTTCEFGAGFARELFVSFDPSTTLLEEKEENVDPYTSPGQGDGQLGEVAYADDVPVFGITTGERLRYYCYCDGQQLDYLLLQAHGARVTWITPHDRPAHHTELAGVTESLALLRSGRSICSARGLDRSASYAPPIPQTESIDNSGDGCHLYLQPGRGSLQRYAEVVPVPQHTLAQIAADLRRDRHVTRVAVDGDRLSWSYVERGRTWRGVTVERGGAQVTWSATPRQWRQEADVYRAFVRSVRLLPR